MIGKDNLPSDIVRHGEWDKYRQLYADGSEVHICYGEECTFDEVSPPDEEKGEQLDGNLAYDIVQDAIGYVKANVDATKPLYRDDILTHLEIYALRHKLGSNPWGDIMSPDTTNMAQCAYCNEWTTYTIVGGLKVSDDHFCRRGLR